MKTANQFCCFCRIDCSGSSALFCSFLFFSLHVFLQFFCLVLFSTTSVCMCLCVRVYTSLYVCVTLSRTFLFNHLGEISNILLKFNMKDNLSIFTCVSPHTEPGNYLFPATLDTRMLCEKNGESLMCTHRNVDKGECEWMSRQVVSERGRLTVRQELKRESEAGGDQKAEWNPGNDGLPVKHWEQISGTAANFPLLKMSIY